MEYRTNPPNGSSSSLIKHPAWRYDLAHQTVRSGHLLFAHQADEETRGLAHYLRKERSCSNAAERNRLQRRYPGLSLALSIYRDPSGEQACQLEALMLARESTPYIADRLGVSRRAVKWYRAAFYSVGANLNDVSYIMSYAIRREREGRLDDYQMRLQSAMKLIAYFCGTQVLEQLFLMGRISIREQWRTPETFIRQLSSMADIVLIADPAHGANMLQHRGIENLEKWREHILDVVKELINTPQPKNTMERTVARDLGNAM
jgi:hypothetical protein